MGHHHTLLHIQNLRCLFSKSDNIYLEVRNMSTIHKLVKQ